MPSTRRPRPDERADRPDRRAPEPILSVRDLAVAFGDSEAVSGVDLTVYPRPDGRDRGESGSGKTTTANAVLNLLPRPVTSPVAASCSTAPSSPPPSKRDVDALRGSDIGLVPRTMSNLNPLWRSASRCARRSLRRTMSPRVPRRRSGLPSSSPRRHSRCREADEPVPARVLGRHAPARADRDRSVLSAQAARRGRADIGARRHRAAADPRSPRRVDEGPGHRRAAHHARPRTRRGACLAPSS